MSSETVIDLSGYRDRVGDRVEPGTYTATVEDVEVDQTSKPDPKTGKPSVMINIWLRIKGGEFDGAVIIERLVQRDTTLFRTVGFLQALGIPTPKKRFKLDLSKTVGKQLSIDVDDGQPYQGRVKSEVRGFNRLTKKTNGSEKESADLDDLEDVAAPAEEIADGLDEFAGETTENPAPEAASEPESAPEPAKEPEAAPAPAKAEKVEEKPADVDAPEEFDLDSIEL